MTVYFSVRAKEIRLLPPYLPRTAFTVASISRALQIKFKKIDGCERYGTCTRPVSHFLRISGLYVCLAWLNSHHEKEVWTLNSHFCHLFLLFQHTFIQSAKSLTILNNMIQEALNIMEEESTREDNEV